MILKFFRRNFVGVSSKFLIVTESCSFQIFQLALFSFINEQSNVGNISVTKLNLTALIL